MRAAYLRSEESLRRPLNARTATITRAIEDAIAADTPSRYGERTGLNWWAITVLIAVHAVVLATLAMTGTIPVMKKTKAPMVVELIPLPPAPPPPPKAANVEPTPDIPVPAAPVAPPPIVRVAAPAPVIQTVAKAPPPEPAPVAGPPTPGLPSTALSAMPGNPSLKYPIDARRRRQEGVVRLRIVIDEEGRVADISIAKSSGFESLDEAALKGIRRWRFQPKVDAGQPVMAVGYFTQPFVLAS
jgi:protein TonB